MEMKIEEKIVRLRREAWMWESMLSSRVRRLWEDDWGRKEGVSERIELSQYGGVSGGDVLSDGDVKFEGGGLSEISVSSEYTGRPASGVMSSSTASMLLIVKRMPTDIAVHTSSGP